MAFATKKELLYMGLLTALFLIIVLILSMTLPLKKDIIDNNKDINNFNPAYDQNNLDKIQKLSEDQNKAYIECITLCKQFKDSIKYETGPCLSDQYGFSVNDWACDIAHNPRIELDNESKNQCKTILNGIANRFVELDENCEIIR